KGQVPFYPRSGHLGAAEFLRLSRSLMSGDEQFRAWAEVDYSVRTGKIAFDKVFGKPIFDYLGEHPDKARIFDAAMVGVHGRESHAILNAYDFSGIGVVADIGGGNGSQMTEILKKHSRIKGILFDLPHVIERAPYPKERMRTFCGTSYTIGTRKSV